MTASAGDHAADSPSLLVIVPTYNEEVHLESTISTLVEHFQTMPGVKARLVVADSSDRDRTPEIAERLARERPDMVEHHRFRPGAGKGEKVSGATLARLNYDYYGFIDADLPISMTDFTSILLPVMQAKSNIAIASKYVDQASHNRRIDRVVISRVGNRVLKLLLRLPVSDLLAGAKAWDRTTAASVWPDVRNQTFFFDAELLYLAYRRGLSVTEVPVHYKDHGLRPSRVNGTKVSFEILLNAVKMIGRK